MHNLRIPRETKKTCVIVILAALLLVSVGSCAGVLVLRQDVAAIEAAQAERDRTPQSAAPTAPLSGAPREREVPKELLAVEEAYTPAAAPDPEPATINVNGQICELVPASESVGAELVGTFKVTHYAPVVECCGKSDGISASGRPVIPYYSVAVDPTVSPLGSILYMDYGDGVLHEVRADDTGKLVKGNVIDLCVSDYETAVQMGVRSATIYRWRTEK